MIPLVFMCNPSVVDFLCFSNPQSFLVFPSLMLGKWLSKLSLFFFQSVNGTSIIGYEPEDLTVHQGWAKSDSKLQALCPDLDHQAFQAFWGNSRKLIEKGKTNILSRLKLYTYGDHVCTLIKIMFLVSSCYFLFKSYSSLMC